MIRVWTDGLTAGVLDRFELRGSTFAYDRAVDPEREVSLTMPIRTASWNTLLGLIPIFEMNLPEGALRERLRLTFAKATGSFDDLDLLSVVGRSQLGRLRFTGMDETLDDAVPFQSVDEILAGRRGGDFFRYLIERFAAYSGISGVQPKFLVRDQDYFSSDDTLKRQLSSTFRGATHIVKFWDAAAEYPQLAANEFFCLKVAEKCGLDVPPHRLAEDGSALVIERFDLRSDGSYRGFEDFCVLNARRTDEKYRGSYETHVMRRFQQFALSPVMMSESLKLFTLISLNCALRNGDAHLKNFGVLYDAVKGQAHLAPVFDVVTTSVYLPEDQMALSLNGTNRWPAAKDLIRFAEGRSLGTRQDLLEIFVQNAMSEVAGDMEAYCQVHPEFRDVMKKMAQEWTKGSESLRT